MDFSRSLTSLTACVRPPCHRLLPSQPQVCQVQARRPSASGHVQQQVRASFCGFLKQVQAFTSDESQPITPTHEWVHDPPASLPGPVDMLPGCSEPCSVYHGSSEAPTAPSSSMEVSCVSDVSSQTSERPVCSRWHPV